MTTRKPLTLALALLACLGMPLASAQLPQPVATAQGLVQGDTAGANKTLSVFRGLPYAAPPVGENRWREPQPAPVWSGVRPADRFAPRCVQRAFAIGADQPRSSEDCLYLNVWTPANAATAKLPVLVWIHGGAFQAGAGSDVTYDGSNLAARGAVVVTINYRLGVFGFLAHPELTAESPHHSSGNYTLLDQLAALQWVQANIGAFGGDAGNVTIVGESAGAQSVGILVATPLAKGLFKRAVLQSSSWLGFTINALPTLAAREALGAELARKAGAATIADLRKLDAQQVFEKLPGSNGINVDGYLLPKDPSLIFAAGEQQPVDVLAGSNSNEAAFFGPGLQTATEVSDFGKKRFGAQAAAFAKLYPFDTDAKAHDMYFKVFSAEMAWGVRRLVQYQRESGHQGYAYFFSHVPPGQEARGATHVAELAYMFNQAEQNPKWTMQDKQLSDQMAQYWVNFAATGNPNGGNLPQWPPFLAGKSATVMGFADQSAPLKTATPSVKEMEFFDQVYQRHLQTLPR